MTVGSGAESGATQAEPQVQKRVHVKVTTGGGLVGAMGADAQSLRMHHLENRGEEAKTEEQLAAEARQEQTTHKYTDGVARMVSYLNATEMTPDEVQGFLASRDVHLAPNDGESRESYMQRAGAQLFQEARTELFGKTTVLAQGGAVTPEALARVSIRGRERMLPFVEVFNKVRFRKQIEGTRGQIVDWTDSIDDIRDQVDNATVTVAWRVNHGRGARGANPGLGRGEVYVDPRVMPSLMREGARGLEGLVANTAEGELVNPLQTVLERFIRPEAANQPATAETPNAAAAENAGGNVIDRARASLGQMAEGLQGKAKDIMDAAAHFLPPEALPFIVNGDTRLSTALESLTDLASQSPARVFQAREALLDLQAYSDAVSRTTNGEVNLMRGLDNHLRDVTRKMTRNKMGMTVSDILAHTQVWAEDYMITDPEAGLTKLFNDIRRERVGLGGDTPKDRMARKVAWKIARRAMPNMGALIDRIHGRDEVRAQEPMEEAAVEEPTQQEEAAPKWWQIRERMRQRKAYKSAVRAAHSMVDELPQVVRGADYQAQVAQREQGLNDMSDDELLNVLSQQADARNASQRAQTEQANRTAEETAGNELQVRHELAEKNRLAAEAQRQKALEQIRNERHALLVAAARSGQPLDTARMNRINADETRLILQQSQESPRNQAELERMGTAQNELNAATTYDLGMNGGQAPTAPEVPLENSTSGTGLQPDQVQALRDRVAASGLSAESQRVANEQLDVLASGQVEGRLFGDPVFNALSQRWGYDVGKTISEGIQSARGGALSDADFREGERQIRDALGRNSDAALAEFRTAVQQARQVHDEQAVAPAGSTSAGTESPL